VAVHRGLDSLPYYTEGQCDIGEHQESILMNMNIKSFPNPNVIMNNFN
jgi:parallel beta-helix repeat protein